MRMHLRVILIRVTLVLTSILVGLLVCEGIVRITMPQSVAVPWQDEVNGIMAPRPNVRGRHAIPHTFDVIISYNSQRFRSRRDYKPEPPPGVIRIAVLGDSFTMGFGANDNETYPAQLERLLQAQLANTGHSTIEVINASNAGSGTGDQVLWYDTWVKQFRPQVVVLTVVPNDVDDELGRGLFSLDESGRALPRPFKELSAADSPLRIVRRTVNAFPGYAFLAQHSQLFGLVRNKVSAVIGGKRRKHFASGATAPQIQDGTERFRKEGIPMMAAEVSWLKERVRESNARLAVVFVPFRENIYPSHALWAEEVRWKSEAIVNTLKEVCSREGIPFADLTAQFRQRAEQSPEPLYYDGLDTHPNPAGYRVIAETVASFLVSERVVYF